MYGEMKVRFHEFGDKHNKIMILIHGALTPWQIWQEQIDFFKENYFIIVPALDAHVEEEPSEYVSLEQEARAIEDYVCGNYGDEVFAVCGLSMGGAIANAVFGNGRLHMKYFILDGAPLVPTNPLVTKIITKFYLNIIHKSKERDKKVLQNFKKDFLPEKYLDSYLKFADTMSDSSIRNMIASVAKSKIYVRDDAGGTKILFLHGTKGNEVLSRKSAVLFQKQYPHTKILCFKGYKHGELAIYKTNEWINTVHAFMAE